MLAGASPLRLIHGKGTGLLGRGLQQYLRAHPHVKDVRFGNPEEGGSGVTVFELS
jgi:DNA mismatch repair protein MutS2